jgi:hypothetical protein
MAYSLEIHRDRVLGHFRNLEGVPREVRNRVFLSLHENLGRYGDILRGDADRRLHPGSDRFWYEIAVAHQGRGFLFRFIVNNASAAFGVLRIEYVDQGAAHQF